MAGCGILWQIEGVVGGAKEGKSATGERKTKSLGSLRDVSLPALLHLLNQEAQTCVVRVTHDAQQGVLFFEKGELVDANTGEHTGAEAAFEILRWKPVHIKIERATAAMSRKIDQSLNHLLLDFCRAQDELTEAKPVAKAPQKDVAEPLDGWPGLNVNLRRLREFTGVLQRSLGAALLDSDIVSASKGKSLLTAQKPSQACALFNWMTGHLDEALVKSGFQRVGKYFLADLSDRKLAITVPLGEFRWFLLLDSGKTRLGLVLNVVLPQLIDAFKQASGEAK